MKKTLLTLILVLAIGLIAVAAHAERVGPGYGQEPGMEPPRTGVGNANSGNHNMHVENHRQRWSYGVESAVVMPEDTLQQASAAESQNQSVAELVLRFGLFLDLAILR